MLARTALNKAYVNYGAHGWVWLSSKGFWIWSKDHPIFNEDETNWRPINGQWIVLGCFTSRQYPFHWLNWWETIINVSEHTHPGKYGPNPKGNNQFLYSLVCYDDGTYELCESVIPYNQNELRRNERRIARAKRQFKEEIAIWEQLTGGR